MLTLPVHPCAGARLPVDRVMREGGRRYLVVELPNGLHSKIPEEWTDRGEPRAVPELNGVSVRASIGGLLALASCVEDLKVHLDASRDLGRKKVIAEVDGRGVTERIDPATLERLERRDADDAARPMGEPDPRTAGRRARGAGGGT